MNDKEKLNKKVFTKEQILEIKNICESNHHKDWSLFINLFLFIGCLVFLVWFAIDTNRYNSFVDYQNKQLNFCQSIYESDHVVLDKCKDYFIILGEDGNERK